jgi:hypothetical protein
MFSFFAFAGAQCREHQRLPLKFAEFMDGHELREAIFEKSLAMGHRMNWKFTMMVKVMCSSRAVGRALLEIMICTRDGSCYSIIIAVLRSLTSRSSMEPNARRSMHLHLS